MKPIEIANGLCQKLYGQSYHEVFGFDSIDDDEIIANITGLERKTSFTGQRDIYRKDTGSFLDIWRASWNSVVSNQPILCELYGLCAMSQVLKHVRMPKAGGEEDDIRYHICSIMPSGTGKSEGNNQLAIFARQMDLVYATVDRYNDASLVGSVNRQAIDHNTKHNKNPGDPAYLDPDEKGILRKSDFVVFDEGENILKTTKETEGAQRYLQKAMNRYGSEGNYVTNTLVGHAIGGHPDCSIVITSYYLQEFQTTLLDRGLLQRMIVYIQEENYGIRTTILNTIIDGIPVFENDPEEIKSHINALRTNRIKHVGNIRDEAKRIKAFHLNTELVSIKLSARDVLRAGIFEIRELMPFMLGQKQIWESMVTRLTVNLLKTATIHALINYRTYIDDLDARYAVNLMLRTMPSLAIFLKEKVSTEVDKKTTNLFNVLRRKFIGDKFSLEEWIEICMREFNLSSARSSEMIKTMIENGKMQEVRSNDKKVFLIK